MVYDESTNGTKVNGEQILSSRARRTGAFEKTDHCPNQAALNPEKANTIEIGKLSFTVWVTGQPTDSSTNGVESLVLEEFLPTTQDSSVLSQSSKVTTLQSDIHRSRTKTRQGPKYHVLEGDPPAAVGKTRRLIEKATGTYAVGKIYQGDVEEEEARQRYRMLKDILEVCHTSLVSTRI